MFKKIAKFFQPKKAEEDYIVIRGFYNPDLTFRKHSDGTYSKDADGEERTTSLIYREQ